MNLFNDVVEFLRPVTDYITSLSVSEKAVLGFTIAVLLVFSYMLIKGVFFNLVNRTINLFFSPIDYLREIRRQKRLLKIQYKFNKKMEKKRLKKEKKKEKRRVRKEKRRLAKEELEEEKNAVASIFNKIIISWFKGFKKIFIIGPSGIGKTQLMKMLGYIYLEWQRYLDKQRELKERLLGITGRRKQVEDLEAKGFCEIYSDDEVSYKGLKSQPLKPILYQWKRPMIVRPLFLLDDGQKDYPADLHLQKMTTDLENLQDSGIRDRHNNDSLWLGTSTGEKDLWSRLRTTGWLCLEVNKKISIYIDKEGLKKQARIEKRLRRLPAWLTGNIPFSFQVHLTFWGKFGQFFRNFLPIEIAQKELFFVKTDLLKESIKKEYERFKIKVVEKETNREHMFTWKEGQMIYLPDRHLKERYDKKFDKDGNAYDRKNFKKAY